MTEMTFRLTPIRVWLNPEPVWDFLNERDMSQSELAGLIGISSGYLSQLMTGARCPSPQVRRRLQGVLEVSGFDDLFIMEWAR